ncbi:hypothetical protein Tco_0042645, partial [Tanacetum coccineum]
MESLPAIENAGSVQEEDAGDDVSEEDAGDNVQEEDAGDDVAEQDAGDNVQEEDAGDAVTRERGTKARRKRTIDRMAGRITRARSRTLASSR